MKSIVIAAGYATRLYPLTENFPKPLLQIGQSTILDRLLDDVDTIDDVTEHIVVTNHKFAHIFEQWAKQRVAKCKEEGLRKPVSIIDDGTTTNESRLGAVRDLLLAIKEGNAEKENLLVMAGDNLLDFSLKGFVDYFKEKRTSVIMCHNEPSKEKLQRTGVITVDDDMRVLEMEEKPKEPKSHWAVPPFYIYAREDMALIMDCMNHGCGMDAPGSLARYLAGVSTLHAWLMPGKRHDIGTMESYLEVKESGVRD